MKYTTTHPTPHRKEVVSMQVNKENPVLPGVQEERDRLVIRCGNSEIVQTKDSIKLLGQCKSRPDFESGDDSSK